MFKYLSYSVVAFILFMAFAISSSELLYKKQVSTTVELIMPDLAIDLGNNALFTAEKRIALIKGLGFEGLSLRTNDEKTNNGLQSSSCWKTYKFPIIVDGLKIGDLNDCVKGHIVMTFAFRSPLFSSVLGSSLFLILVAYFLPLIRYKKRIKTFIENSKKDRNFGFLSSEKRDDVITEIIEIINNLTNTKIELEKANHQKVHQQAMILLAKQVAHDIRSPLSALSLVASTLGNIPEEKRLLIRNSVQRINDIANDLLSKQRQLTTKEKLVDDLLAPSEFSFESNKNEIILLPALVDSLVSEKRIQYREQMDVSIDLEFVDSFSAFICASPKELMRVLSNLINNSIEAFKNNAGQVKVFVQALADSIKLVVEDNGEGIPTEFLKKLGEIGATRGKEGSQNSGSGLGIFHAKRTIECIGGQFRITSTVGIGTSIEIELPRVAPPSWFLESIKLSEGTEVISLDDDLTIHQIWKSRFTNSQFQSQHIALRSFTSAVEFKKYLQSLCKLKCASETQRIFLIDFELLGQTETGLDVIEKLQLGENSILVTSRYEETEIRNRCEKQNIKILPKSLAGFVPIEVSSLKERFDWILIDDDDLVHLMWKMAADEQKLKFIGFKSIYEFNSEKPHLDRFSPVYIDSNLGEETKGEDIAKNLHQDGFKNIYLATGYSKEQFSGLTFINGIRGKEPPNYCDSSQLSHLF